MNERNNKRKVKWMFNHLCTKCTEYTGYSEECACRKKENFRFLAPVKFSTHSMTMMIPQHVHIDPIMCLCIYRTYIYISKSNKRKIFSFSRHLSTGIFDSSSSFSSLSLSRAEIAGVQRSIALKHFIHCSKSSFFLIHVQTTTLDWKRGEKKAKREYERRELKEHSPIIIVIIINTTPSSSWSSSFFLVSSSSCYNASLLCIYSPCTFYITHNFFHFIVITSRMRKVETSQFFSFSLYTVFTASTRSTDIIFSASYIKYKKKKRKNSV